MTRSETPAWRADVPTSTRALTLEIFKRQAERFGIADAEGYHLARTEPPRHWFEPALSELEKGDRG